jgi:predicted ATPase
MKKKTCKICKEEKGISEFHKLKKWYASYCKRCQSVFIKKWREDNIEEIKKKKKEYHQNLSPEYKRNRKYVSRYNITIEIYDEMFQKQEGVCAICFQKETRKSRKFLSIDHCHKTGKVRGLLCDSCNNILGRAKDNNLILLSAAHYLENTSNK